MPWGPQSSETINTHSAEMMYKSGPTLCLCCVDRLPRARCPRLSESQRPFHFSTVGQHAQTSTAPGPVQSQRTLFKLDTLLFYPLVFCSYFKGLSLFGCCKVHLQGALSKLVPRLWNRSRNASEPTNCLCYKWRSVRGFCTWRKNLINQCVTANHSRTFTPALPSPAVYF